MRITVPSRVYEAIADDARAHGVETEDHILSLLETAASGEYVLVRRADV
jgi:hydrogenase maturation factor